MATMMPMIARMTPRVPKMMLMVFDPFESEFDGVGIGVMLSAAADIVCVAGSIAAVDVSFAVVVPVSMVLIGSVITPISSDSCR
jgi:hypothetical protein